MQIRGIKHSNHAYQIYQIMNLKTIEIGSKNPKKLMILMHGYGSNKSDMAGLGASILHSNSNAKDLKIICPDGIDLWEGGDFISARQWFTLSNRDEDFLNKEMLKIIPDMIKWIDSELVKNNLTKSDLILAGFSQGAMMALHIGIDIDSKIAGIISFSGTLLRKKTVANDVKNKQKICFIHGELDEVLPCAYSKIAHSEMQKCDWNSTFFEIKNMDHSINQECINIANSFLNELI